MTDIARVVAPQATQKVIGVRPGEKIHEQMIGLEDAPFTYEYQQHFKILPSIHDWNTSNERIKDGVKVPDDFVYSSDNNPDWMEPDTLADWIDSNHSSLANPK
ncbi:polysaccharide biosynthesis protein [Roseobacter litoralis]|uniref:polysaccharide biosynthesis protein n=1 Tax=Roseobacter litoralis TaxID=42443 RepID=UPI0031E5B708